MKVIKRDGTEVPFDEEKIIKAIRSANSDVAENDRLSEDDAGFLVQTIRFQCESLGRAVSIEEIQDMVIEGIPSCRRSCSSRRDFVIHSAISSSDVKPAFSASPFICS